jgi:DnaJ homolog subfamily C member 19
MVKFLIYAAILCAACKLLTRQWPWDFLLRGRARAQAAMRARKLLGVRAEADRTEIIEAHRRLLVMVHPDRGGSNDQVHEANAARDLLLDELPDGS